MGGKTDEKFVLPDRMTEEEFEKQFNICMKETIAEATEQFIREITAGSFILLEERIKKVASLTRLRRMIYLILFESYR